MFACHPWTAALIGAAVLWLSSLGGSGQVSPPKPDPLIPVTAGGARSVAPLSARPVNLAELLSYGDGPTRPDLDVSAVRGELLPPGPAVEQARLARRLQTNVARREAVETGLPSTFVLVNITQARLWMVRDGKVEGSMRVIVGRPDQPTPEMMTALTHVILNPRWNVPQDIVQSRLAPAAARTGGRSLNSAGFEVMSSWQDDATVVPADDVDWRAVAAGRLEVPVRQKPTDGNAMGSAKFVMTNDDGIYLHDTPDHILFQREGRTLSAGCIRVEDYRRLLAFLVQHPLSPGPEMDRPTYVRLGQPMPIYLTYITAIATDEGLLLFPDPYHRDS